ncbi:MAG: hypothetical protein JXR78_10900 [Victivallales bacterium]|nr:hypothetical protein [Victivallales bacterium]
MFREYAIDPAVVSDWERFRFLDEIFQVENGRFVSEVPKKWKRMVFDGISCKPVQKTRVTELLKNWTFAAREKREYGSHLSWFDNILNLHNDLKFEKIIVDSDIDNEESINIDILDRDRLHYVNGIVNRNAVEMMNAIKLLLQTAKTIKIIDPYYGENSTSALNTFREMTCLIDHSPYKKRCEGIEIYTCASDVPGAKKIAESYQNMFSPHIPVVLKCDIFFFASGYMHNRFIMSDIVGVQLGHGLLEKPNDTDDYSILSKEAYNHRYNEYTGSNPKLIYQDNINASVACSATDFVNGRL